MKNLSKNTKSSLTTYGMVVAAYIICELFLQTGHMTSLLKGLLVPLCVYAILMKVSFPKMPSLSSISGLPDASPALPSCLSLMN